MTSYKETSPYRNTTIRSYFVKYLGYYSAQPISEDPTDEEIVITPKYNERPDLLSNELYGTPDLWWIFTLRNPDILNDPIYDFVTDAIIFAPSKSRAYSILGRK